uniref:Uncharacterized protein n=1 Tax=Peronospora matthiolae TaxID=2874970 RepID=A0AAV1TMS1_9STRA
MAYRLTERYTVTTSLKTGGTFHVRPLKLCFSHPLDVLGIHRVANNDSTSAKSSLLLLITSASDETILANRFDIKRNCICVFVAVEQSRNRQHRRERCRRLFRVPPAGIEHIFQPQLMMSDHQLRLEDVLNMAAPSASEPSPRPCI